MIRTTDADDHIINNYKVVFLARDPFSPDAWKICAIIKELNMAEDIYIYVKAKLWKQTSRPLA